MAKALSFSEPLPASCFAASAEDAKTALWKQPSSSQRPLNWKERSPQRINLPGNLRSYTNRGTLGVTSKAPPLALIHLSCSKEKKKNQQLNLNGEISRKRVKNQATGFKVRTPSFPPPQHLLIFEAKCWAGSHASPPLPSEGYITTSTTHTRKLRLGGVKGGRAASERTGGWDSSLGLSGEPRGLSSQPPEYDPSLLGDQISKINKSTGSQAAI